MIPNDPKRAGEKFQRCRNRSSKLFTRTHIHMPVRVAIRRRGWHRGGGGKGTIKNKIKKTVLSKSRCNRLTTRGIYVESFLGAIMLFVSVAREIYRVYSTTSAHVAPTASNHGNPRPDTRSCLSQITRENDQTPPSRPITLPLSLKLCQIDIKKKKKKRNYYLLFSRYEKLEMDRRRNGANRLPFSRFFRIFLPSRGREGGERAWCVDDRYFYRSDATSLPP